MIIKQTRNYATALFFLFLASCGSNADEQVILENYKNSNSEKLVLIRLSFTSQIHETLKLTDYEKPNRIEAEIADCSSGYNRENIIISISNDDSLSVYVPYNDINCRFIISSITLTDGEKFVAEDQFINNSSSYWKCYCKW